MQRCKFFLQTTPKTHHSDKGRHPEARHGKSRQYPVVSPKDVSSKDRDEHNGRIG
jgi:hypothetical protein